VGSALGIGSVIGNSLSGLLIHRIGSKMCLLLISIPHSVGVQIDLLDSSDYQLLVVPLDYGVLCQECGVLDRWTIAGWYYRRRHLYSPSFIYQRIL